MMGLVCWLAALLRVGDREVSIRFGLASFLHEKHSGIVWRSKGTAISERTTPPFRTARYSTHGTRGNLSPWKPRPAGGGRRASASLPPEPLDDEQAPTNGAD